MSATDSQIDNDDETTITEITIQPDGRVYVFGTSRDVLEMLSKLRPGDARLGRLVARIPRSAAVAIGHAR